MYRRRPRRRRAGSMPSRSCDGMYFFRTAQFISVRIATKAWNPPRPSFLRRRRYFSTNSALIRRIGQDLQGKPNRPPEGRSLAPPGRRAAGFVHGGQVGPHEPVQLVGEVGVGGPAFVLGQEPLHDDGEGGVEPGAVAEEAGLLAEPQQGPLGLEASLGGPGPGDQDPIAFAAEVGAPGAPAVPRSGDASHGWTLQGHFPRNIPESLERGQEGIGRPVSGTGIPSRACVEHESSRGERI